MNTADKRLAMKLDLLEKTIVLRKKIKRYWKFDISKKIYIKTLLDIEKILSSKSLDIDGLYQNALGIGRVVTDGDQDKPIGKELWSYLATVYEFYDSIKEVQG